MKNRYRIALAFAALVAGSLSFSHAPDSISLVAPVAACTPAAAFLQQAYPLPIGHTNDRLLFHVSSLYLESGGLTVLVNGSAQSGSVASLGGGSNRFDAWYAFTPSTAFPSGASVTAQITSGASADFSFGTNEDTTPPTAPTASFFVEPGADGKWNWRLHLDTLPTDDSGAAFVSVSADYGGEPGGDRVMGPGDTEVHSIADGTTCPGGVAEGTHIALTVTTFDAAGNQSAQVLHFSGTASNEKGCGCSLGSPDQTARLAPLVLTLGALALAWRRRSTFRR